MRPSSLIRPSMTGAEYDALVEHDGEVAADVGAGEVAEPAGAVGLEREAHGRPVVLVEGGPRVAQVAPAHHRGLLDQVVDHARRAPGPARRRYARQHLGVGRHVAAGRRQQLLARAGRSRFDQLQLEQRRRLDDLLGARDVAHARQLDQDLILPALTRDDGLGHAELVDAALDGADGLIHRLLANLVGDVRLHAEGVGAGRTRLAVVGRLDFGGRLAEHAVLLGGDAGQLKRGRAQGRRRDADAAGLHQLLAQPVHRRLGLQPQRVVGLDAEDQVDAAFEVEAKADLLRGRVDRPGAKGHDRRRWRALSSEDSSFTAPVLPQRPAPGPGTRRRPSARSRRGSCRPPAAAATDRRAG